MPEGMDAYGAIRIGLPHGQALAPAAAVDRTGGAGPLRSCISLSRSRFEWPPASIPWCTCIWRPQIGQTSQLAAAYAGVAVTGADGTDSGLSQGLLLTLIFFPWKW